MQDDSGHDAAAETRGAQTPRCNLAPRSAKRRMSVLARATVNEALPLPESTACEPAAHGTSIGAQRNDVVQVWPVNSGL